MEERFQSMLHGTANLKRQTASSQWMIKEVMKLFDRIINPHLTVRRINISANHVVERSRYSKKQKQNSWTCLWIMMHCGSRKKKNAHSWIRKRRSSRQQLQIKKKYGKNAVLKGMNLEEGANTIRRNETIGGHKA